MAIYFRGNDIYLCFILFSCLICFFFTHFMIHAPLPLLRCNLMGEITLRAIHSVATIVCVVCQSKQRVDPVAVSIFIQSK